MTTHNKEYSLYRIKVSKQTSTTITTTNSNNSKTWGKGGIFLTELTYYVILNVRISFLKNYNTIKKHKSMAHNYGCKKQSTEIEPEETQIWNNF